MAACDATKQDVLRRMATISLPLSTQRYASRVAIAVDGIAVPQIVSLLVASLLRTCGDKHKANISITMLQFDERWNAVYDFLRHFENGY